MRGLLKSIVVRRLLAAVLASFVVPWAVGMLVKQFHQPGLDDDAQRSLMLIDFIVIGGIVFALTMVVTAGIGCWINAVMHGPRRDGDAFPHGQGMPMTDDR